MTELDDFQARLGVTFDDPSLLRRALTHRSYLNEHPHQALEDNERLEFLGDAVLDFVAADWLYHHFPEMSEGAMTRMRAALVRTEALAGFARSLGVDAVMRLGKGEEESGGRQRAGNLCAAFEAVVGAIYLDKGERGLMAVQQFVYPLFEPTLERLLKLPSDKDPKSLLQEWSQAELGCTPQYRTVSAEGPDHAKEFTIEVTLNGQAYGRGTGRSKQSAAQNAAREALERAQRDFF
ncbi:MAG: ribonuclease III [Anaerolineae bacterium]